ASGTSNDSAQPSWVASLMPLRKTVQLSSTPSKVSTSEGEAAVSGRVVAYQAKPTRPTKTSVPEETSFQLASTVGTLVGAGPSTGFHFQPPTAAPDSPGREGSARRNFQLRSMRRRSREAA